MMEQIWKWETTFVCGERSSFLQFLLDEYGTENVLDMVRYREEDKAVIKQKRKEIETGMVISALSGKAYSWKQIKNGDGLPAFKTKDEFDADCRETIEEYSNCLTDSINSFKQLWEEYLNHRAYYHGKDMTFEQAMRDVWKWSHEYRKILEIQNDMMDYELDELN
ncbi:hypothetical protein DXB97_03750 [Firmicutes bacterium OM07-11]|nr:hypothetical protein DXB97_03750 [Firmicutes bacterium OM07-11]